MANCKTCGIMAPKSNLTAHMSSAGRFVSDRTKGWRLKTERDLGSETDEGGEPKQQASGSSDVSLHGIFPAGGGAMRCSQT